MRYLVTAFVTLTLSVPATRQALGGSVGCRAQDAKGETASPPTGGSP
jgi:hypothetical protein